MMDIKNSQEVVSHLIKKLNINTFDLRFYIRNTDEAYDDEVRVTDLSKLNELIDAYKKKDSRYQSSFQSRVQTNNGVFHVPMIDFSNSKIKNLNIQRVKEIIGELGIKNGFILNSGRCYHFYGEELLTEEEWIEFIKRCAFYEEIGEKFISHQRRRGKTSLRIMADENNPKLPEVVETLVYE